MTGQTSGNAAYWLLRFLTGCRLPGTYSRERRFTGGIRSQHVLTSVLTSAERAFSAQVAFLMSPVDTPAPAALRIPATGYNVRRPI